MVQLDIGTVAAGWLVSEVAWRAGMAVADLWAHWAGPPCRSQSGSDASNKRVVKGRLVEGNFRDKKGDPAHPEGNWRGDVAREGDLLSSRILAVLRKEARWALENPMGALRARDWMLVVEALAHRVDYCAYWTAEERAGGKGYQKQSVVWTDVDWHPSGTTGTGVCGGKCECRRQGREGMRHDRLEDQKRAEVKCRVPQRLVGEWLRAAGRPAHVAMAV